MARRRPGSKPLSGPMMIILPMHIYTSLGNNEFKLHQLILFITDIADIVQVHITNFESDYCANAVTIA